MIAHTTVTRHPLHVLPYRTQGAIDFVPTGTPNAGDIAIRPFRKKCKEPGLLADREYFNARLKMLKLGYKSPHTLLDYAVDRTLGTGSFGRVLLVQVSTRLLLHSLLMMPIPLCIHLFDIVAPHNTLTDTTLSHTVRQ